MAARGHFQADERNTEPSGHRLETGARNHRRIPKNRSDMARD